MSFFSIPSGVKPAGVGWALQTPVFLSKMILCLTLSYTVFLGACGGGENDTSQAASNSKSTSISSQSSTNGSTTGTASRAPSFPSTLNAPASTSLAGGNNLSQSEIDALNRVNQIRTLVGVGTVSAQYQLNKAAQSHTAYQLETSVFGHVENMTSANNFTGNNVADRVNTQGYDWNRLLEVTAMASPMTSSIALHDLLTDAVYHRLGMLRHDLVDIGVGYDTRSGTSVLTMVYGRPSVLALAPMSGGNPVTWPINNQINVSPTFSSDTEAPDPVPGQDIVGYPVSLQVYPGISLTTVRFRLFEETTRAETELTNTKLLTSSTDSNIDDYAVSLIPLSPLKSNTLYKAVFEGQIDGVARTLSWQFTTF